MKRVISLGLMIAVASVSRAAEDHSGQHRFDDSPSYAQHHDGPQSDSRHESHVPREQAPEHDHQEHVRGQHERASPDGPTESERKHVPPDPPSHAMHDMSNEQMIELMGMDDTAAFGMIRADRLEWRDTQQGDALAWDAQAWYGNDYNKLRLESEGERVHSETEARIELLWDRVFARWWNAQVGVRQDSGEGPSRSWAAFGVEGLAPYWFEVDAKVYVGEHGRTAARFAGEYELLLTQRLILQPQLELDLYGQSDVASGIGSGLAHSQLAVRLRYEIRREFAPYAGLVWVKMHGETADLARQAGRDASDVQFVAGVRVWF